MKYANLSASLLFMFLSLSGCNSHKVEVAKAPANDEGATRLTLKIAQQALIEAIPPGGRFDAQRFHINVEYKTYNTTFTGLDHFEDIGGSFYFEDNKWHATPPRSQGFGCKFGDKK